MGKKIFLIGKDDSLVPLTETAYEKEDLFQALLEKYPEVLAGHSAGTHPEQRWFLVSREYGVPGEQGGSDRWSLDHLFLDEDGVPTLVEVKRATDTRVRREVVAQMLDYAANAVVYWPVESIRAAFDSTCERANLDPKEVLVGTSGDEESRASRLEGFWQSVKTNLQAGRIRLVFVADQIPVELLRIVEFLNGQMDPAEVLAVEVRQFIGGSVKTLVPTLVGQTQASQSKKSIRASRNGWTEQDFFQQLSAAKGSGTAEIAKSILEWIRPKSSWIFWGSGQQHASLSPTLSIENSEGKRQKPSLFTIYPYGTVEIKFEHLRRVRPFDSVDVRRELLARLRRITEDLPEVPEGRPGIPLETLGPAEKFDAFRNAIDWGLQEIGRANQVVSNEDAEKTSNQD